MWRISRWALSATIHGAVLLALLLAAAATDPPAILRPRVLTLELRPALEAPRLPRSRDSGGGQRSPQPAQKGVLPRRPPSRLFVPPQVAASERPKLTLAAALEDSPAVQVQAGVLGDPFGGGFAGSGPGLFSGFGGGDGGGAGDGSAPGVGTLMVRRQQLTRRPELIYKEEPVYSEAARRARVQGYVRLRIEVGVDGRPTEIHVVQGMGLGLDESAVDAVKRWRFRPALIGDRPVAAPALVEVGFHLL